MQKNILVLPSKKFNEVWAGGFAIGSYLYFTIETGNGYKKNYRVQDQSGMDVGRAVSGTITRAVEKIFQDKGVLAYIVGMQDTASSFGSLLEIGAPKTVDYDKNTEIAHDFSLLLVVEKISLSRG